MIAANVAIRTALSRGPVAGDCTAQLEEKLKKSGTPFLDSLRSNAPTSRKSGEKWGTHVSGSCSSRKLGQD
jgi:hypothetical protein